MEIVLQLSVKELQGIVVKMVMEGAREERALRDYLRIGVILSLVLSFPHSLLEMTDI